MKDASGEKKEDNAALDGKLRVREVIADGLAPDALIFEGFAGEGAIWRRCWRPFRGVTIDWDRDKAKAAALARPTWAVYGGDTERALLCGLAAHVPFAVVDLDCYGSPWKYLRAWIASSRVRARVTSIVLTDGYMGRASLSALDGTLFPGVEMRRMNVPPALYMETARARLAEWLQPARLRLDSMDTYKIQQASGKIPMRAHVLRVAAVDE